MTKAAAVHQWFSSLGLTAYVSSSVPDGAQFPYLTYEFKSGAFGDLPIPITVNAYWHTDSEKIPNAWVENLSKRLISGNSTIVCDDGFGKVWRGNPFAQSIIYEDDTSIKRRYINLNIEWFTQF